MFENYIFENNAASAKGKFFYMSKMGISNYAFLTLWNFSTSVDMRLMIRPVDTCPIAVLLRRRDYNREKQW